MTLVNIIVILVVLGLVWWLFSSYVLPRLPEPFRTIIIIVVVLFACVWLLSLAGLIGPIRLQ